MASMALPLASVLNSPLCGPGTRRIRRISSFRHVPRGRSSLLFPSSPRAPPLGLTAPSDAVRRGGGRVSAAYVSAPASDANVGGSGDGAAAVSGFQNRESPPPAAAVSSGVIWALMARHTLRIAVSLLALIGCTSCTLSMPIFSGTNSPLCSASC